MRSLLLPILAIFLVLGLAACAEPGPARPETTGGPAPAVPAATEPAKVAPPPALEGAGTAPTGEPAGEPAGAAPQARPRQPSEQDVADCYRYARATVAHDRRIEQDRGDAGGFGSLGSDVGAFSDQLSRVGETSTFDRAYESCMTSKGYGRR